MTKRLVIVPTIHFERGRPSGLTFQVPISNGKAQVSVLELLPQFDPSQVDNFREILRELGAVLTEAAQRPESILWHLPDKE